VELSAEHFEGPALGRAQAEVEDRKGVVDVDVVLP